MIKSRNSVLVLIFAVACVLLIPLALMLLVPATNHQLFLYINHQGAILPDAVWANITLLGDGLWAMGFMSIIIFIANSKEPANTPPLWARTLACATVYGGICLGIVVQLLKQSLDVYRPSKVFSATDINIIGEPLSFHSFPSGHSATIFYMLAITLAYLVHHFSIKSLMLNLRQIILVNLLIFAAAIIAISRITTGVHFPADILAGSLLGWLFGWASVTLLYNKLRFGSIVTAVALALIGLASILLFFHDSQLPQVELLTLGSGIIFTLFSAINLYNLALRQISKE